MVARNPSSRPSNSSIVFVLSIPAICFLATKIRKVETGWLEKDQIDGERIPTFSDLISIIWT